jgi:peptide/nickel transport system substrate-binding protein
MNKKIFNTLIITICSALLLSACATNSEPTKVVNLQDSREELIKAADPGKSPEAAKNRKDTFIAGIRSPGGVFLPYFYENGWDGNATEPIFAPLVRLDKEGKPIPILAEKWDISPDQLIYTFHVRQGLKFSDGSPLTADDVAFTLTLLQLIFPLLP